MTGNTLTRLMEVTAALLDKAGRLERLTVAFHKDENYILIETPAFEAIGPHRSTIDRIAELLGSQAALKPVTGDTYSYTVQGSVKGVPVLAMALTPPGITIGRHQDVRATSTPQTVTMIRALIPWAAVSLDLSNVRSLVIHDHGRHLTAQLLIAAPKGHEDAADAFAGILPSKIERRGIGHNGYALLPTGHTLSISTTW